MAVRRPRTGAIGMTRRLFLAAVFLAGLLGLAASPAPVRSETSQAKTAYEVLQTDSDKHEMGDAYLLAYASCYVFPDLLGVKDRNDHKNFTEKFAEKFLPL